MKSGDYGCVSIPFLRKKILGVTVPVPNIVGYLIRLATWSRYDHSFIYIGNGEIIESQAQGAAVAWLTKYNTDKIQWSTDMLTPPEREAIVNKAHALLGTPYGFLDIAYLALATLGVKFKWLLAQVEREDRLICSQLVATCGEWAGVDAWLCNKLNACLVTPADLARHAERKIK